MPPGADGPRKGRLRRTAFTLMKDTQFMQHVWTHATRRTLLTRIRVLALGGILAPSIEGPLNFRSDAVLLKNCADFAELEGAKLGFFYGRDRIDDDDEREERIAPLLTAQVERLGQICNSPALTSAGLRAKSATWQLWDAGELAQRVARHGLLEDRLLVSVFQDLEAVA